jgi:hypothetical protein
MTLETVRYGRVTRVNVERATPEDIEFLRENYPHFLPLYFRHFRHRGWL